MKNWTSHGLVALAAAPVDVLWPYPGAIVILGSALMLWAVAALQARSAENSVKAMPVYKDLYYTDGELDAFERYASYWRNPVRARRRAAACGLVLAALLGAALPWFFVSWPLAAVALMFAVGLSRRRNRLDPVTWLDGLKNSGDTSSSGDWEDVMNLREKLIAQDWPWNSD